MTEYLHPKKRLGQHFLKDRNIARKIVSGLQAAGCAQVVEIGPGMGMLTQFLLERPDIRLKVIEIDGDSVAFLRTRFPGLSGGIVEGDFLTVEEERLFEGRFAVIGNFPYNISSQLFFRILELRDKIPEVVCMIQREVAERIVSNPGNKTYGILSVLIQSFYRTELLFRVGEQVFFPPPKVQSAVIRLVRNDRQALDCNEPLFFSVVKTAFNQRRKMLRNALEPLCPSAGEVKPRQEGFLPLRFSGKRAEQLSPEDFEEVTRIMESLITQQHGD